MEACSTRSRSATSHIQPTMNIQVGGARTPRARTCTCCSAHMLLLMSVRLRARAHMCVCVSLSPARAGKRKSEFGPYLQSMMTPSKLAMKPQELYLYALNENNFPDMSDRERALLRDPERKKINIAAIKRMRTLAKRLLQKHNVIPGISLVGVGPAGNYQTIIDLCRRNSYDILSRGSQFSADTVYVISEWHIDHTTHQVAYMLTSEKLLRNVWLQQESGMDRVWCVDCTHRVIAEGHAVYLVGLRDVAQVFHTVAMGVVSNESDDMLTDATAMVAEEYRRACRRGCESVWKREWARILAARA